MEILLSVLFWFITSQQNHFADMRIMAMHTAAPLEILAKVPEKSKPVANKPAKPKPTKKPSKFTAKPLVLEDWKADIARYICTKDWDCKTAVAVAMAESGLNPDAKSPTNDHGVMQLNGKKIYNAQQNIDEAFEMYKRRGWQPWSAYNNGAYKKYTNLQTASGSLIQEGGGSE